jgi:hypothetical protein
MEVLQSFLKLMIAPKVLKDEIQDKLVESTFKLFAAVTMHPGVHCSQVMWHIVM